jgi:hypothetical protein
MSALAAVALVWLGTEKPEPRAKALLDAWGADHGLRFEEPATERSDESSGDQIQRQVGEACERELDQARDQFTAGDERAARQTLARVEQELRDQPRLLQAAWLLAERYRLEAQIARSTGAEGAALWDERADALEGERAAAFGEDEKHRAAPARIDVAVAVRGARRYEAFWDGARATSRMNVIPGEHHLLVLRGGQVDWAGWVSVLRSGTVDVWVRDAAPCSAEDLAGLAPAEEPTPLAGIRCPRWALSMPGPAPGTVRVALCQRERCEPMITERATRDAAAPSPTAPSRGFPAWATWTLAGLGAALATSVVLWKAGVFDHSEPTTRVVYDGSKL